MTSTSTDKYAQIRAAALVLCESRIPGFSCGCKPTTRPVSPHATDKDVEWHRNAGHFACTFSDSRGRSFTVIYSVGEGHREWKPGLPWSVDRSELAEAKRKGETPSNFMLRRRNAYCSELVRAASYFPSPHPMDVLHSVCMDRLNDATFEQWCDEYGFDRDSRKAEALYRTCDDQEKRALAFFGRDLLGELAEVLADL